MQLHWSLKTRTPSAMEGENEVSESGTGTRQHTEPGEFSYKWCLLRLQGLAYPHPAFIDWQLYPASNA